MSGVMADVVEVCDAVKCFRTPEGGLVQALDGVNLIVAEGEFVTLLGPSGCGKTTLLRAISGFEPLDSGELRIQGRSMQGVPPHLRPVHTVFQSYALFPHMNLEANVGYALDVRGVAKAQRNRRVGEVLELVGLAGMQRRKPAQLSGGQQQRVALARALVDRPALLLLDEPLSALDRKLRQTMQRELKHLQHELGIAFVFVTHDQEEALTMSDRIVVLNGGRIQQSGAPAQIYDRPANAFVAGFIGDSNLYPLQVQNITAQGAELVHQSGERFWLGKQSGLTIGRQGQLLLRPEQFYLTCPGEGYAQLRGQVEQWMFLGKDFELLVRSEHGLAVKATVSDTARQIALQVGQAIRLWYAPQSAHWLEASSA
ncbi:ABC transporter ATP-binding protein [Ventosimonas gracilis]|nr:ABC transporter ATP-binding protein [Ventosimonas gracilis]